MMLPTSMAAAATPSGSSVADDPQDAALALDASNYTTLSVTVDGQPVSVRSYKELCYVANPVAAAPQQPGLGGGSSTIANTRCGYESHERVRARERGRQPADADLLRGQQRRLGDGATSVPA